MNVRRLFQFQLCLTALSGCSTEPSQVSGAGATPTTGAGGSVTSTGGVSNTGGVSATLGGAAATSGGTTSTGGSSIATGGKAAGGATLATGGIASTTGGSSTANAGKAVGGATAKTGGAGTTGGATAVGGAGAGGKVGSGGSGIGGAGGMGAGGIVAGGLRWVGRVDATSPDAAKFAWQGAGFVATVTGTSVAVKLRTEGTSTVFFQPVIDGIPGTRFKVDSGSDQTVTLGSSLSATDHLVELYRETEGMYGVSTFLGFTSGTVKGAPAASGRMIEVVGDSISAGYGNLGSEPHPNWVANPACHWTADNSSWYLTYAAVAGHALNAEVSTIARSGWGMYRDLDGNTTGVLSSIYDNSLGTSSTAAWSFVSKASVVVLNLGTNDWAKGDPGTPYETAYVSFIAKLRSHYPDAWIFLTIGSMLSDPALTQVKTRLSSVVSSVQVATGDQKITTFDLGVQNTGSDGTGPTGCDWHPNVTDHKRMAGILQQQLSTKLGW